VHNIPSEKFRIGSIGGEIYKKIPQGENPAKSDSIMEKAQELLNVMR
jgi:hypothetical protein